MIRENVEFAAKTLGDKSGGAHGFSCRLPPQTVTISYPVFPLIPPYSVSESPNPLFFLDLV